MALISRHAGNLDRGEDAHILCLPDRQAPDFGCFVHWDKKYHLLGVRWKDNILFLSVTVLITGSLVSGHLMVKTIG